MLKYHIQTIEVPSGGSSAITFSNIPQIYDDLVVVVSARLLSGGNIGGFIRVNGVTQTGVRVLYGTGSGVTSEVNNITGMANSTSWTASTFSNVSIHIPNYRSSFAKSYGADAVTENNGTQAFASISCGLISDTSPITSLGVIDSGSAGFSQHSSASLYGIKRGSDGRTEVASGGTITTSGGFTYHTFNTSGTFVANRNLQADVLVVAGGGGGGAGGLRAGGGGGAGGYQAFSGNVAAFSYPIVVGAGGAVNALGSASSALSLTSIGGGFGGIVGANGVAGGSGGGAGEFFNGGGGAGTPGQGNNGGPASSSAYHGGGGGGAGAAGGAPNIPSNGGGLGGNGLTWVNGITYAGGGGGGSDFDGPSGAPAGGAGGTGGGGRGAQVGSGAVSGTTNSGSGGGGGAGNGGSSQPGGAGGSGVVIIRYRTPA